MKQVIVIGAGISGLAFAHRLEELSKAQNIPIRLTILEKSSRIGGAIATESREGFLIEKGPDSFLSEKPWALELARDLFVGPEIIGTHEQNRRVFVARSGELLGIPQGFHLIAPKSILSFLKSPLFSWQGKARVLMEMGLPKSKVGEDESIASFIERRFGKEALQRVGQPMIAGVYSGDPEQLSMQNTMPRFKELEAKYGSVILGLKKTAKSKAVPEKTSGVRYSLFLSFKKGMETLTRALADSLPANTFYMATEIEKLYRDVVSGKWTITARSGQVLTADLICFALPAKAVSPLIHPFEPALSEKLNQISYESVATLYFAYPRQAISHSLNGFGFVVPAAEKKSLMACTFVDKKFPGRAPSEHALFRVFVGGAFGKRYFEMSDQELTRTAQKELSEFLGIKGQPIFSTLHRHTEALPQYKVGHASLVAAIETKVQRFPGLYLTGASYRGTGISDCVHDARVQADMAFEWLSRL